MYIDKLYEKIHGEGIDIFSYNIPTTKAVVIEMNNKYGIFIDHTKIKDKEEEFCVLAHEYGHCTTGSTHKINSSLDTISRHEFRADKRAILEFCPLEKIKKAIQDGCKNKYEIAKYLQLPEQFIEKAIYHYKLMGKI
jgi:Zn-dependent peptidase ImmA (M78 family)